MRGSKVEVVVFIDPVNDPLPVVVGILLVVPLVFEVVEVISGVTEVTGDSGV